MYVHNTLGRKIIARLLPLLWCEPKKLSGFLAWKGVKEAHNDPYIRGEDSNYRSGTENAGLHQTLRGTILDKYSCFGIASMLSSTPAISFYWYRLCEKFIGSDSERQHSFGYDRRVLPILPPLVWSWKFGKFYSRKFLLEKYLKNISITRIAGMCIGIACID